MRSLQCHTVKLDVGPSVSAQHQCTSGNGNVFCVVDDTLFETLQVGIEHNGETQDGSCEGQAHHGQGIEAVSTATAFTMAARPESECISDERRDCGVEWSDAEYNPFDVYAPPGKQCLVETSLTDWKRSRHLFIKSTSVQHGVKHLRNILKTPKVGEQEFQVVDLYDEYDDINPSHFQLHRNWSLESCECRSNRTNDSDGTSHSL